jgi:hypothetical protein
MRVRPLLPFLAFQFAAACSTDGPTSRDAPYPEVAGAYDFTSTVAEIPGGTIAGWFALTDDSQATAAFGGTYLWIIRQQGREILRVEGGLSNATVSRTGQVSFDLEPDKVSFDRTAVPVSLKLATGFHHDGAISGTTLTTSWTMNPTGYSGTLTGTRR